MSLGLGESLQVLVKSKYQLAKAGAALTFAPSQLAVLNVGGVPVRKYRTSERNASCLVNVYTASAEVLPQSRQETWKSRY